MTFPNLGGVIKADDVFEKGSGSYAASYVAWAKTSQLLRDHAPGWGFYLAAKNEEYVWKAPDGSGYLMCFFENSEEKTPLFPFPIMDKRNNSIPCEKISARTFTDSHRRSLCACAAFTFGLAYELWAKEEIESPKESSEHKEPLKQNTEIKKERHSPFFIKAKGFIEQNTDPEKLNQIRQNIERRFNKNEISEQQRNELFQMILSKDD
mgnify:FL=1